MHTKFFGAFLLISLSLACCVNAIWNMNNDFGHQTNKNGQPPIYVYENNIIYNYNYPKLENSKSKIIKKNNNNKIAHNNAYNPNFGTYYPKLQPSTQFQYITPKPHNNNKKKHSLTFTFTFGNILKPKIQKQPKKVPGSSVIEFILLDNIKPKHKNQPKIIQQSGHNNPFSSFPFELLNSILMPPRSKSKYFTNKQTEYQMNKPEDTKKDFNSILPNNFFKLFPPPMDNGNTIEIINLSEITKKPTKAPHDFFEILFDPPLFPKQKLKHLANEKKSFKINNPGQTFYGPENEYGDSTTTVKSVTEHNEPQNVEYLKEIDDKKLNAETTPAPIEYDNNHSNGETEDYDEYPIKSPKPLNVDVSNHIEKSLLSTSNVIQLEPTTKPKPSSSIESLFKEITDLQNDIIKDLDFFDKNKITPKNLPDIFKRHNNEPSTVKTVQWLGSNESAGKSSSTTMSEQNKISNITTNKRIEKSLSTTTNPLEKEVNG